MTYRCPKCGQGVAPVDVDVYVSRMAERLRETCLKEFGSTWSYDFSWKLAEVVLDEAKKMPCQKDYCAG